MQFLITVFLTFILMSSSMLVQAQETKKYYENGTVQFEYSYRSGQLHGLSKEYHKTGELKAEHTYKLGKLVAQKKFRRNGDLEYELKYENGQKVEYQIEYHRNGKKKAERNYKNDKKEGSAKSFHVNGNAQGEWIFKNGEPVRATIFYSTGEKWLLHTDFDEKGMLNGVSKEYDKKGKIKSLRYYKNNEMYDSERFISNWHQLKKQIKRRLNSWIASFQRLKEQINSWIASAFQPEEISLEQFANEFNTLFQTKRLEKNWTIIY